MQAVRWLFLQQVKLVDCRGLSCSNHLLCFLVGEIIRFMLTCDLLTSINRSWHSDFTRERMWHYLIPLLLALPCFAVWTHVARNESYGSIKPISLYGIVYLGKWVSIAQPAALAYRTSSLYGASEQAVGGAAAVAALSISSIIGPQVSRYEYLTTVKNPLMMY